MKKLSSMIALGLTLSMVLGMTAFAAESSDTGIDSGNPDVKVQTVENAAEVKAGIQEAAAAITSNETAKKQVEDVLAKASISADKVEAVANVIAKEEPVAAPIEITSGTVEKLVNNELPLIVNNVVFEKARTYIAVHVFDNGDVEYLPVRVDGDNSISVLGVTHFSSFTIYDITDAVKAGDNGGDEGDNDGDDDTASSASDSSTSPKTGETVPAAAVAAMIALAGAAIAGTRKVRYNR